MTITAAMLLVASVAFAQTPRVRVNDQSLDEGTVTVRLAVSDGPGFVVIHRNDDGSPGEVIGHTVIKDGRTRNVTVGVDTDNVTDTLYAMLHSDTGKTGTFEFPDADPPVTVEEETVVQSFAVEDGGSGSSSGN